MCKINRRTGTAADVHVSSFKVSDKQEKCWQNWHVENVEDNLGGNTCNVGFIERLIIGSIICMSSCVGRRRSDVLIYLSYYCSPQRYTKDGSVALEMLSYSVQFFFFFLVEFFFFVFQKERWPFSWSCFRKQFRRRLINLTHALSRCQIA